MSIGLEKSENIDENMKLNLLNVINNDRIANQLAQYENLANESTKINEETKFTTTILTKNKTAKSGITLTTVDNETVDEEAKNSKNDITFQKYSNDNGEILITDD